MIRAASTCMMHALCTCCRSAHERGEWRWGYWHVTPYQRSVMVVDGGVAITLAAFKCLSQFTTLGVIEIYITIVLAFMIFHFPLVIVFGCY